ncbi:MAG: outer membrane protein transport protein [Marinifilaceae bacterium]|jgi:long-chain fatty acid transport protein|nr:outer membrane protein transport protein [Marinifilaceae bacterium]
MLKRLLFIAILISMGFYAKSEGFAVNAQGNKQMGMGHVGTAIRLGASSMQWNPGLLGFMDKKYEFSLGGSFTFIKTEFTGPQGKEESDNPIGTPFYFYSAMKASEKLAFGLAVYTPFGNKVEWGDKWSGRYLVQDIDLKAIFIQPTVSYKLTDWLGLGAGVIIGKGDVELNKAIPLGNSDGKATISGSKIEYGYNLGLYIEATDKLNFGISYRSGIDVELGMDDGEVEFSVPQPLQAMFPKGGTAVTLPLPSSLNIGVSYEFNDKLIVSAEVNSVNWSEYESLDFDFENNTPALKDQKNKRDWDNTLIYRLGAQYRMNEKLDLRAGIYYDETPTNKKHYSPETPGANKIGISAGFSYMLTKNLCLDASLLYMEGEKTTAYETSKNTKGMYEGDDFGGEYKNTGWLPGIGISYNF